ncbi:tellurite resistance TerB C-terminal domain-containing protein [Emticicia sp. SJ17W-69]|uniref:tellurite resistance TerB C-terminal domain-containing protein n=1 Tax=Emticicia sp. SJ17W-69 TaxID=3421657 RepID=UPI003EBCAF75
MMIIIFITGIIIYIIYSINKPSKSGHKTGTSNPYVTYPSEKRREPKPFTISTQTSSTKNLQRDASIIDVTNYGTTISHFENTKKYHKEVPYWRHQYVYSYQEIDTATDEQKSFYKIFKTKFLIGEYLDVEGNSNYYFILLFDLLNEYESHKDLTILTKQLKDLGINYPKTKSYAALFLAKKFEASGRSIDSYTIERNNRDFSFFQGNTIDYQTYDWRKKYKTLLKLSSEEEKLLEKIWYQSNNFFNIDYCCRSILKLFIHTIAGLNEQYLQEGTTLESQFLFVADIIAKKNYNYRRGSQNYKYCIENVSNDFHLYIFKYCENAIREYYGHKRKINVETNYTQEIETELNARIISKVKELLPDLIKQIPLPDEVTDIELYAQNTNRWRIKFEELSTNYNGNPNKFTESVIALGNLNIRNPSVENIFFEASKFMAKHDKEKSLYLYIYYLYYDLKSEIFDNKQLTKTIQKNLFKTEEQLKYFEVIVQEFVNDKDLNKALSSISKVYAVKRKKIKLDEETIQQVQQQHSGTVELLNEYLRDDSEDTADTPIEESNDTEIELIVSQKKTEISQSIFLEELSLKPIQTKTLELFAKNNLVIAQSDIEAFAKSNGVFKNQLIDSINDTCYEHLDDLLIEEDDDDYTINNTYYQRILTQ